MSCFVSTKQNNKRKYYIIYNGACKKQAWFYVNTLYTFAFAFSRRVLKSCKNKQATPHSTCEWSTLKKLSIIINDIKKINGWY